jgi:CheY-like chemotaxis protein
MPHGILLVDDQRDILRLLHSTLDTLKNPDLMILEAPSGEEALLEASRHKIDLLVTDYLLPGITGVELMHKIRARHPEVKVILITGVNERRGRDEMLNAGAMAIFDKPIPMADFLDVVERGLGLVRTIFPAEEADAKSSARQARLSDLLANFRQDIKAQAVFLLNDRGLVQARAGDLRDSSMEVSLISGLMAIHSAGLKVARYNRQESPSAYHVFNGGDHDLIFLPVDSLYALLVAGNGLAREEHFHETVASVLALRNEVEKALKSMGVTGELHAPLGDTVPTPVPAQEKKQSAAREVPAAPPSPEIEALLQDAEKKKKVKPSDVDSYWDRAAEKHGNIPTSPDVITYDQARKLGLISDKRK